MKYAVGIDWGGTTISIGLVSEKGEIIKKIKHDTADFGKPNTFFKKISPLIAQVCKGKKNIMGIGVGAPGFIAPEKGYIFDLPNIAGWKKIEFSKLMEKETSHKTYIDNDVNVIALAEQSYGAGKGYDNILCLTLGTGVGGGLILNGSLYHGAGYNAGEIGHYPLKPGGALCGCGNKGCLEAYIGNSKITAYAKSKMRKEKKTLLWEMCGNDINSLTPKHVGEAAKKGDKLAVEIWDYVGKNLAVVLAGVINLLNIERIVIGGGVALAGKPLFDSIKKHTKEMALDLLYKKTSIVSAKFKEGAGIIGGASLVFNANKKK